MVAVGTTPLCKRLSFLPVMLTRREKCKSGKKEDLITIHKFRKDTCNSLQESLYKELFVSDRLTLFISGLQCPRNVVLQRAELISVPIFLVRKVLPNWSQQKVKHDFAVGTNLQFLPRISSRVYSVNSKNSSEAKICQTRKRCTCYHANRHQRNSQYYSASTKTHLTQISDWDKKEMITIQILFLMFTRRKHKRVITSQKILFIPDHKSDGSQWNM